MLLTCGVHAALRPPSKIERLESKADQVARLQDEQRHAKHLMDQKMSVGALAEAWASGSRRCPSIWSGSGTRVW